MLQPKAVWLEGSQDVGVWSVGDSVGASSGKGLSIGGEVQRGFEVQGGRGGCGVGVRVEGCAVLVMGGA